MSQAFVTSIILAMRSSAMKSSSASRASKYIFCSMRLLALPRRAFATVVGWLVPARLSALANASAASDQLLASTSTSPAFT